MKLIALLCNIIVVTGGTVIFIRNGQLNWRRVILLVVTSVPLAFVGAKVKLSQDTFFVVLGCSLIVAAILLWVKMRLVTSDRDVSYKSNYIKEAALGAAIGFLSGMVGIGGGIFLSPVLNLMKWDTPKKIAAAASFFILVNSISGIAGQLTSVPDDINVTRIGLLCAAVFVGGQVGARTGMLKFDQLVVRRVTALVVFIAGVEVLHKHLPWFK
jgi:uncharacterized membrane protein YfcA